MQCDMVIIGGGICGLLAARQCRDKGLSYTLIEREKRLGGNWHTKANDHSFLQAYEPMYRWDPKYKVHPSIFGKAPASKVREQLEAFASDNAVTSNSLLSTEAVDVTQMAADRFLVNCKSLVTGEESVMETAFLCVTCGILGDQWTAEERGVEVGQGYRGKLTQAGRHLGMDSLAGTVDLAGKRVVVMGSGSFAIEAAEAAARQNAQHITIVSRPRYRWVLPFSRQFTLAAVAFAPLVPWRLKMRAVEWYLRKFFYGPCGIDHWLPRGAPADMDYSGQSNDGYFRLTHEGRLTCIVDRVVKLDAEGARLASRKILPCDLFVVAAGCKYNLQPPFLASLGLGFHDLHSYAFLGRNPRIGTASDFVFAFVPAGPLKQLEMFFHSVQCCRAGKEAEVARALEPTALPDHTEGPMKGGRMAGSYTWFQTRSPWSPLNLPIEERSRIYLKTMSVGKSAIQRLGLRVQLVAAMLGIWILSSLLAVVEIFKFPVYGKGVPDHHVH
ncbi:hypothetical protein ACKKBF_B09280 [Auxenochlorella protothecoides x Auxenochlorella symbiontica]